ncbi:MAG: hypothetical protein ACYTBJ_23550 [Planctomycetota bacterium]|jgi:hypothetical protein
MMTKFFAVVSLASMCLCTGCAKYWYQEGKTFEECKRDRQECFNELKKYSDWERMGDYEFGFMEDCMKEKGYRLVTEDKLPLRVKREEPDRTFHVRLKGIAGTIEKE